MEYVTSEDSSEIAMGERDLGSETEDTGTPSENSDSEEDQDTNSESSESDPSNPEESQKSDNEPEDDKQTDSVDDLPDPKNLILIETFDEPELVPVNLGGFYPEFATNHAFSIDETIKRKGRSSGRFEIRKTDPLIWGGTRAEISQPQNMALEEGWYGFSQYFPASYTSDTTGEVIAQWHDVSDDGEAISRSPSNAIITSDDRLKWMLRWDADRIMTSGQSDGLLYFDLGEIPKGQWIDWVVHIKYSYSNSGILEVWKDGVKVIERINEPNSYNDQSYPYLKLGIYRWEWGQPVSRVLYYDEIRVGNGNCSYNDVSNSPQ